MKDKYCQCCAMPMGDNDELYGINEDGTKNNEYCKYCYDNGRFTYDCTMDEMIDFCVPHMLKSHPEMSEEKAKKMMQEYFPMLKRWKNNISF